MLVGNGLLDYDKQFQLYRITEKGSNFLKGYETISNYIVRKSGT
jgi:predicted transcriptional regulator